MTQAPGSLPPFDRAHQRQFAAGEMILYEGDPSDAIYLIETGQVEVTLLDPDQGEELILALLGEGEIFGEMSLFSEEKQRCATIRAMTDTTVRLCNKDRFLSEAERNPDLWMQLIAQLANRLRSTNRRYSDRAFHNVKTRIAHVLADLGSNSAGGDANPDGDVRVTVTRTDLGRYANCSREVAGQAVLDLAEEGLLAASGREIHLTKPAGLRNYGQ